MAFVELQYEGKEPCYRCVHKNICEATRCLDEIRYTVRHLKYPLFNIKVECTEFYNEGGVIRNDEWRSNQTIKEM